MSRAGRRQHAKGSRQKAVGSGRATENSERKQGETFRLVRRHDSLCICFIRFFLLCLSPTAFCLLPTAYFLLPTASSYAGAPGIDAFTRHGAGVRAIGMGKAATSLPMGAASFYWNPAGVGYFEGTEVTSLFSQPFSEVDDLQYHTAGFAHRNPSKHVGYGLSVLYFDAGELRGATAAGALTGSTFEASDMAAYFTVGAGFGGSKGAPKKAAVGANFKAVQGKIDIYKTTSFGADLGFLFMPVEWFRLGAMVENLVAPTFTFRTTQEKFPLRIRGGASIDPFSWMTLAADVENEEGEMSYRFGGEIRLISNIVALRGGYVTDTKEFLAGAGIGAKFVRLDYAYSTHDDLGQTHRAGLTIRFK